MELISIQNVSFEYIKGNRVLQNIEHSFEERTINIILGLNGCGKTTLIKLIAGLLKPTSGKVTIGNQNVININDYNRSKLIAYVPQLTTVRNAFTVEEYLLLSLTNQRSIYWHPKENDRMKVRAFAKKIGINENMMHRRIDELSGGERQIVMICGALLQESKIIILDEPTASLDMKNQYVVLQFLKRCHKYENKTIIFSCHDPNHALRLGGNTIALHQGKKILEGESRSVIKATNLKSIYGENVCDSKDSDFNFITIDWK